MAQRALVWCGTRHDVWDDFIDHHGTMVSKFSFLSEWTRPLWDLRLLRNPKTRIAALNDLIHTAWKRQVSDPRDKLSPFLV